MFPPVRHIANKRGACHTKTKKGDRGMKTTKLFLIPIILVALIFTSCSDYDYGYDEKTIRYERGFYEHFGKIDPNQDWNLVKQLREKNGRGTRSLGSYDNRNMWLYPIRNGNTIVDFEYFNGYGGKSDVVVVPGFPSLTDGKYHVRFSEKGPEEVFDSKQAVIDYMNKENKGAIWPAGDVTDEEIIFVSQWFRAHKLGENHEFPCTKFYVQQISGDVDLVSYPTWDDATNREVGTPGAVVTHSNKYEDDGRVTQGRELAYRMTELKMSESPGNFDSYTHLNNFNRLDANFRPLDNTTHNFERSINFFDISNSSNVDFASNGDGGDYNGGFYMDHWTLQYLSFDINGRHYEGWYLGLDYDFQFMNSAKERKDRDYHFNNWILKITPAYSVPTPDVPTIPVEPDPDPKPTEEILEAGLLCCEDMGGVEADFDFNDIVLKLEHKRVTTTENSAVSTKDIFVVTAMAAGGTLPSYVFYKPLYNADDFKFDFADDWMADAWNNGNGWVPFKTEADNVTNGVHDMWSDKDLSGQTSFEPLNVGQEFDREGHSWEVDITAAIEAMRAYENSNEEEQEMIRHYADHYVSYVFDRVRIRIYVNPVMNADGSVNTNDQNSNYIEPLRRGGDSDVKHDDQIVSETPRMLLLPLRFEWPTESTFIGNAYQDFGKWVNNAEITEWYLNKVDKNVTSRNIFGEEELQPRLRWGSNADGATEEIYMSVTLKSGESMTIPFTTLSDGDLTLSSSDNNIAYATNVDKNRKQITITANNPGTTTITLTQDAWTGVVDGDSHQYRSESIMLYVTVEGNGSSDSEKEIKPVRANCYSIEDVLAIAGTSEYVTITFISQNYNNWYNLTSIKGDSNYPDWYSKCENSNCPTEDNGTRCTITVPTSFFKELEKANYSQFYVQCGSTIIAMYVKAGT